MSCDGKHVGNGWREQDISTATSSFMRTFPSSQMLLTLVGCEWFRWCLCWQTVLYWSTWVCNYFVFSTCLKYKGSNKNWTNLGDAITIQRRICLLRKNWVIHMMHIHNTLTIIKMNWTLAIVCSVSTWLSQMAESQCLFSPQMLIFFTVRSATGYFPRM